MKGAMSDSFRREYFPYQQKKGKIEILKTIGVSTNEIFQ